MTPMAEPIANDFQAIQWRLAEIRREAWLARKAADDAAEAEAQRADEPTATC